SVTSSICCRTGPAGGHAWIARSSLWRRSAECRSRSTASMSFTYSASVSRFFWVMALLYYGFGGWCAGSAVLTRQAGLLGDAIGDLRAHPREMRALVFQRVVESVCDLVEPRGPRELGQE